MVRVGSAVAVAVTSVIFCEIPSWREQRISHLNPLCWDWWLESFMLMTSLQVLVVWVLFKNKRRFIPAEARAFLSEVLQPATQGVFVDDGGSYVAFELGQPPFSYLLVHVSIFYWNLLLGPGPSNTELNQGIWSNWRRQNPRYFVWYLLSPGHHFMAEIFGVFSINSWVAVSKTAVVSKPWR